MIMPKDEREKKLIELLEMRDMYGPDGNTNRFQTLYKTIFKKEPPITYDRSADDYRDKVISAIIDGTEIPDEVPDNVDI